MPQDVNGKAAGTVWLATIRINDPTHLVKPEMVITMCGVRTGEVYDVLSVPLAAVAKDANGRFYVDVQQGNAWTPTFVQTGLTDGQYIQITSGVDESQVVQVPPKTAPVKA